MQTYALLLQGEASMRCSSPIRLRICNAQNLVKSRNLSASVTHLLQLTRLESRDAGREPTDPHDAVAGSGTVYIFPHPANSLHLPSPSLHPSLQIPRLPSPNPHPSLQIPHPLSPPPQSHPQTPSDAPTPGSASPSASSPSPSLPHPSFCTTTSGPKLFKL